MASLKKSVSSLEIDKEFSNFVVAEYRSRDNVFGTYLRLKV